MHISGILVACNPLHQEGLRAAIGALSWADVHFLAPDGRMVVTIEGRHEHEHMDRLKVIKALPRVLTAEMVEYRIDEHGE